jgi:hypothetical protein
VLRAETTLLQIRATRARPLSTGQRTRADGHSASVSRRLSEVERAAYRKWAFRATSAFPLILLQKSFWGGERKFLELLMRFARGDVRDHIVSHKNDHGASYERYGVLQWWSRLKISFCEIFGVVQFSTFATLSP